MTHHYAGNLPRGLIRSIDSGCAQHAVHRKGELGGVHGAPSKRHAEPSSLGSDQAQPDPFLLQALAAAEVTGLDSMRLRFRG